MRAIIFIASSLLVGAGVEGFQLARGPIRTTAELRMAYVPDGFTPEQYAKFKAAEKKRQEDQAKKNLGQMGPKGFKSRSFQSFQEALERGETTHLMPVFNAKEKVARGEIKVEDIPYMQRGGSWDNSDVKGAKRAKWLASDKQYASGGYKKEQSVSIFGYGEGLDWTGKRAKTGPGVKDEMSLSKAAAPKMQKNYKPPSIYKEDEKPKKFFGLF